MILNSLIYHDKMHVPHTFFTSKSEMCNGRPPMPGFVSLALVQKPDKINHFHHHLRSVKQVKGFLIYTVYNTQTQLLRYCLFKVSNEAGIANLEIVFSRCQFSIFTCVLHKAKNVLFLL